MMKPIKMVDLKSQYDKIKDEVDVAISSVIENTAFINGSQVGEFRTHLANYLHVNHVITCGNGTDALQIALMALGLQPGDEVITVPFTFIASAEVIGLLRLECRFVDVDKATFNMDVSKLEAAITPKTKAIIPVHLFGQCADMEKIMQIAEKYNLFVVEDACQAIGAEVIFSDGTRKKAGTIGNIGCTSFFPSKNLGCYGDGGALFTNDDALAKQISGIANHGMFVRYHHEMLGVNSRLDTLQAAVLDVKLKYLDNYIAARQKAAAYYDVAFADFSNIEIPEKAKFTTHVYHQYTLKLHGLNREKLIENAKNASVPIMIYYPIPLHLQPAFSNSGYKQGDFPVSEELCQTVCSLPMHTELTEEQQAYIVKTVLMQA